MPRLLATLFALALASSPCVADPLQLHPQYSPSFFKARQKVIDPDKMVYGLAFGATEAELIKAFGDPSGVIAASETVNVLLYGSSHLFVLRKGKFRELLIADHVIDWRVARRMERVAFFDGGSWTLAPGIQAQMSFEEVASKLKKSPAKPGYRLTYETSNAEVELEFSSTSENGKETGYVLRGVSIKNHGD